MSMLKKFLQNPNKLIAGKRVYLRSVGKKDHEEFLANVHLSKQLHYPWVFPPTNEEQYSDYYQRSLEPNYIALKDT